MPTSEPLAQAYSISPNYDAALRSLAGPFVFTTDDEPEPHPRDEVYDAIDGERDYQDQAWAGHSHEVGAYITMLTSYVRKAQDAWTDKSGDYDALHAIRKIAAIAVHCMEEHGAPKRGEVINQYGETVQTAY